MICFFFFFSSRRRHTRLTCDWSSDVCSSDLTVTGLRALLRFLYLDGQLTVPLAGAVPSAACWQLAALPRGISPGDLAQIMDSCDQGSVAGRRDFAIVLLLARLGLRAGEV